MQAAAATRAVAAEERGAYGGGEVAGGGGDGLFARDFLAGVEIERGNGIAAAIGGVVAAEDLFGGKMDQAGADLARQLGESGWGGEC